MKASEAASRRVQPSGPSRCSSRRPRPPRGPAGAFERARRLPRDCSRLATVVLAATPLMASGEAATFRVTKTADTPDRKCDSECSLRGAPSTRRRCITDEWGYETGRVLHSSTPRKTVFRGDRLGSDDDRGMGGGPLNVRRVALPWPRSRYGVTTRAHARRATDPPDSSRCSALRRTAGNSSAACSRTHRPRMSGSLGVSKRCFPPTTPRGPTGIIGSFAR